MIPNNPDRKRRHPFDAHASRGATRIATRYDKPGIDVAAAIAIAACIIWCT